VNRFSEDLVRKIIPARLRLLGSKTEKGERGGMGENAADAWGLNKIQTRWGGTKRGRYDNDDWKGCDPGMGEKLLL